MFAHPLFTPPLRPPLTAWFLAMAVAVLLPGCATSFHYTPLSSAGRPSVDRQAGLAIATGRDERPADEREPNWAADAETIVARALAAEVKNARLFRRVRLHTDTANPRKYSTIVQFRVLKFSCLNHPEFLESTGRDLLYFQGLRGALIARSIPTKYVASVAIEFAVLDAATRQSLFTKTYSATRTDSFNGYQGEAPKVKLTSAALATVLGDFVKDLAGTISNPPAP